MPRSSTNFSPCRLDWRPSRIAAGSLAVLCLLAGLTVLGTRWAGELPLLFQALLGACALPAAIGSWRFTVRHPRVHLELLAARRARWTTARGVVVEAAAVLHEQWPLTTVRLLPRGPTVVFWPDNLCDSGRRRLRRWAAAVPDATPLTQFWIG